MRPFILAALLLPTALRAQQTFVLFIGNSYTYVNDLPNTFRQLALSMGNDVTVASSAPGGYTFEMHSTYAPTLTAINAQPWDYVVLQEQSQRPAFPQTQVEQQVFPFAAQLVDSIRANDPCSQPVFYMTWGRQNGDADNCASWPPVCTFSGMNDLLQERYVQMAEDNDAYTAPVGVAWEEVRATHPLINLYQADGSHPSVEGTYLAACVFFCNLFGEASAAATFTSTVQPDTAAILRAIADAVVLGTPADWNLDVTDVNAFPTGSRSSVWSEMTYTHGGVGTHLWTCSNGQSFTTPDATFTFGSEGAYTFSHVFTDACGHTDTDVWEWLVSITGVEEMKPGRTQVIAIGDGLLEVRGADSDDELVLFDAQGRVVLRERLGGPVERIACGAGLHLWRISAIGKAPRSGSVLVR